MKKSRVKLKKFKEAMIRRKTRPKIAASFLGAASTLCVCNFKILFVRFESIKRKLYSLLKKTLVVKSKIRKNISAG